MPTGADRSRLPSPVIRAVGEWIDVHDRFLPGLIEGIYLVGSVALGDWWPGSDVDLVAFTADPADDAVVEVLAAAHAEVVRRVEHTTVDGPILAWGDVSVPPMPALRPYTEHGRFHHDGGCFEINPVTWYTLATYGLEVRGEPVDRLGVPVDVRDRLAFVRENTDTYWRDVATRLSDAVEADPGRDAFAADGFVWAVLGVARMLFTAVTGDVASKSFAGAWAADRYPSHAAVLGRAVDLRRAPRVSGVGRADVEAAADWVAGAVVEIVGG